MEIRFLRPVTSPHGQFHSGHVFDWPNTDEAAALIRHGVAEAVAEPAPKHSTRRRRTAPKAGA